MNDGETTTLLKWNKDMLDLPICRAIRKDGKVGREPLTQTTFTTSFGRLLTLANYVGVAPSLHQIRRFLGGEVNSKSKYLC